MESKSILSTQIDTEGEFYSRTILSECTHVISLDLGSDSMAAYCIAMNGSGEFPIPLQEHAISMLKGKAPEFLLDKPNDRFPSTRLNNRFELKQTINSALVQDLGSQRPDRFTLSPEHARLMFCNPAEAASNQGKTAFIFFHDKDHVIQHHRVIPNAKLAWQSMSAFFPAISATEDKDQMLHISPLEMISQLTCQIVNNFALGCSPLKHIDRAKVLLVLTTPNIYSPSHRFALQNRIEELLNAKLRTHEGSFLCNSNSTNSSDQGNSHLVRAVLAVSESDAVIAYEREQDFKHELFKELELILNIDVGRGTTDASLIQLRRGLKESQILIAKTGKLSGGNELSYIFAFYFQSVIDLCFQYGFGLKYTPTLDKAPFSFMEQFDVTIAFNGREEEIGLLRAMFEEFIEFVKRNTAEDGKLNLHNSVEVSNLLGRSSNSNGFFGNLLDGIVYAGKVWQASLDSGNPYHDISIDDWINFKILLKKCLLLEDPPGMSTLTSPSASSKDKLKQKSNNLNANVKGIAIKLGFSQTSNTATDVINPVLRLRIVEHYKIFNIQRKAYVQNNSDEILLEIAHQAACGDDISGIRNGQDAKDYIFKTVRSYEVVDGRAKQVSERTAFNGRVVFSGQGVLYKPLRRRFTEIFNDSQHVHPHFLEGASAKLACAEGAAKIGVAVPSLLNPFQLHGQFFIHFYDQEYDPIPIVPERVDGESVEFIYSTALPLRARASLAFVPGIRGQMSSKKFSLNFLSSESSIGKPVLTRFGPPLFASSMVDVHFRFGAITVKVDGKESSMEMIQYSGQEAGPGRDLPVDLCVRLWPYVYPVEAPNSTEEGFRRKK